MFKVVQIKRMPIDLWRAVKVKAVRAGVSLQQYVINALREAVEKK